MPTPVVDPLPIAPSPDRPSTFSAEMFAFLQGMQPFPGQINALVPFLALAGGRGPISAVYTFSAATAGATAAGQFRLNNATQASATGACLDRYDSNGVDVSGVTTRIGAGASAIKGDILVTLAGDPTVWLSAEVTSAITTAGDRIPVLQNVAVSAANPFTAGDQVVVTYVRSGDIGPTGAAGGTPHAIYEEQRTNNTNSSTPNVNGAHNTVALNTEVLDTLGIFSLSGNDVIISAAGTYYIEGWVLGMGVDGLQASLYNVTDGALIKPGLSGNATYVGGAYSSSGFSHVTAVLTIAGAKTIRLRAFTGRIAGSSAMGQPVGGGIGEVYSRLTITKL